MSIRQKAQRLVPAFVFLVMCCSAAQGGGVAPAQDLPAGAVGEITMAIGQGRIVGPNGERDIARGQRIEAGDWVETSDGGHVHIRFIDGGLVSVRPLSRLHIEDYRNTKGDNLAAIKFRLEAGVVRSVTGQWGEANRDRFRLNTPIAAIGVKGTDFVVKVESGTTFASVISGSIVMAPLEGACASSLGPCLSEHATQLSADMQGQMLEYLQKNGSSAPRLVPSVDLLARDSRSVSPKRDLRGVENIASEDKLIVGVPGVPTTGNTPDVTPPVQEPVTIVQGKPMIWLHNALGWNVPENTISEKHSSSLADGRKLVVGNFFINLYRDEMVSSTFQPGAGSATFRLTSASANYVLPIAYNRPVEIVNISSPILAVDFARATFSTQLQLSSPSLGQDVFSASGTVNSRGIFVSSAAGQSLTGAFSMDGREAGYQFEKNAGNGKVSGLTLWGR